MFMFQEKFVGYKKIISYIGCLLMLVGLFLPALIVESDMGRGIGLSVSIIPSAWGSNIAGLNIARMYFITEWIPILAIIIIVFCVHSERFKFLLITSLVYIGILIRICISYEGI